ncbi:HEPN domain-containing protein [Paraflavitalea pollutisoli]|uniref:HEPN domain-containing protein n=1 Tax=Paraflavitalea pollutisoli TaxID=3034143 RepID=UPI0023EC5299|nr:HEPN domain-containing protein [Paraflavitalea sp. H1-2-19X]
MKPSFDLLPEKKQHEIRMIVEFIKQVIDPEMVILFGSYAKNKFVEHRYYSDGILNEYISDYDFLVVTKDNPGETYEQEHKVLQLAEEFEPPVNLEIHGVEFINKGLEWGHYFWVDIVEEGIILYDKKTVKFTEPRELSTEERRKKTQDYFDLWFPQSLEFLSGSHHFFERGNYKTADFMLQQTVESLYYAILLVFTDYKPKIHNLWRLRKKVKPYSEELFLLFHAETDKNDKRLFELLKQGYIEARYDPKFIISQPDISTLIDRVTQMLPIAEKICKLRIAEL